MAKKNSKQILIEKFNKAIKSGKLEEFHNYIVYNNLTDEFINAGFYATFSKGFVEGSKEYEDAMNLSNFDLKLSKDTFDQKFGTVVSDKLSQIIYETEHPSMRMFNIFELMRPTIRANNSYEASQMLKILDIASQKNQVVGLHTIGAELGDTLSRQGVILSGHKFVANDYGNRSENVKSRLEKNFYLYDNEPISFFTKMINERHYNRPQGQFNDVMIISIPKEELQNNNPNIIQSRMINGIQESVLNPEYIKGYSKVNVQDGSIYGFYENPLYRNRTYQNYDYRCMDSVQSMNTSDWKHKFNDWYEQANTTKFQSFKNKVSNFFKGLLNKDKDINIFR